MTVHVRPPDNPAGEFDRATQWNHDSRHASTETIRQAPQRLHDAVQDLTSPQLNTKYRNWTVRQIVHHLADSHMHCYIRFKWTLTEDRPVIKAYDESKWSDLVEARTGDIEPSLQLLAGLHRRWVQLIEMMTDEDFSRTFVHPEFDQTMSLADAIPYYAWHCRHHTGQILWLREHHNW